MIATVFALCVLPDPFSWAGGDSQLTSLWHVAAGCTVILGIEALFFFWKVHIPWLVGLTLIACVCTFVLAVSAGHLELSGFPLCAGAPELSATYIQTVERDTHIVDTMQQLGRFAIMLVFIPPLASIGVLLRPKPVQDQED